MRAIVAIIVALAVLGQPAAARASEVQNCMLWTISTAEADGDPVWHIHEHADGQLQPDASLRSISYTLTAKNLDSGKTKSYKGTDGAPNNAWARSFNPAVGWGNVEISHRIIGKFDSGLTCKSQTHTTDYYRPYR